MHVGKLFLLPNVLEETLASEGFLPASLSKTVGLLQGLIAESEKVARRYLRRFMDHDAMARCPLALLNEHTSAKDEEALLSPMVRGETWGLISDAGLPCIADPGAGLVAMALDRKILVEALAGPCSLILALQLSGFSGQRFCFHGYLPRQEGELEGKIKDLEKRALGETQIWIEAPYRSGKMFEALKRTLQGTTRLCVAASLTSPSQRCFSYTIAEWRKNSFELGKEPVVFLIFRNSSECKE